MTAAADLSSIPVVDNHCHAVEAEQAASVAEWRQYFSDEPYRATFPDLPVPPEVVPR